MPEGDHHPSFGSPAIRLCLIRGFASSSRDEFAILEKGVFRGLEIVHGGCQEWLDSSQRTLSLCHP